MNIYVGGLKQTIHIGNIGDLSFVVHSPSSALEPAFNGVMLKSSDDYAFCLDDDSYLTVEEN